MNTNHPSGSAVTDADLIRYLDGELDLDESERIEAAIAGDDSVAGRLAVLSRRGRNLSALLGSVDPSDEETRAADPVRRAAGIPSRATRVSRGAAESAETQVVLPMDAARARRGRGDSTRGTTGTRWLKAAIVVFALLGAGLLVPPVRAWIVDRLESIARGQGPEAAVSPDVPSTEDGAAVAFGVPVTGPVLEVTLDESQAGGELIVEWADIASARIEPLDAATADPVVVTPGAVRIDNDTASTGGYRLLVPRSVTRVRMRFGAGDWRTYDVAAEPVSVPLSGGGA